LPRSNCRAARVIMIARPALEIQTGFLIVRSRMGDYAALFLMERNGRPVHWPIVGTD
jgi:hypothetical protein